MDSIQKRIDCFIAFPSFICQFACKFYEQTINKRVKTRFLRFHFSYVFNLNFSFLTDFQPKFDASKTLTTTNRRRTKIKSEISCGQI